MGRSVHRGPFNFSKEVSRPPDHWLKLARETRALAERVSFDTAKKRLLELAKDQDIFKKKKKKKKKKGPTPKHSPCPAMTLGNMRQLGVEGRCFTVLAMVATLGETPLSHDRIRGKGCCVRTYGDGPLRAICSLGGQRSLPSSPFDGAAIPLPNLVDLLLVLASRCLVGSIPDRPPPQIQASSATAIHCRP